MAAPAPVAAPVTTPAAAPVTTPAPAATPVTTPAPAATPAAAPITTPAPAAAPAVQPAAAVPAEEQDATKRRVQLSAVLGISISQARCATHLKQNLGDDAVEAEIKALRAALKAAKDAGADLAPLKAQIAEKSKTLVRISSETPIAAAVTWDAAVKELLRHGMEQAIAGDRKIVDTAHLHAGNVAELTHYPLYNKCEGWTSYDPAHEEELRKDRAAANKAAKDAREAKKGAPAAEDDANDEDAPDGTKTTFNTYVESALKTVKKDEAYAHMRVSNRVREYLSELVAQGLARLAQLARIIVQRVVGVRTMNSDHMKAVLHVLMADEGRTPEQINSVAGQIDERLALYHGHLSSERAKKAAALDGPQRVEHERKQRELDHARKLRQADLATRRARDATEKARALTAEAGLVVAAA
jgi:hypothetical protein